MSSELLDAGILDRLGLVETSQPNAECLYGIGGRDEVTHDDIGPNK